MNKIATGKTNGNYEVAAVRKALEILCEFGADPPSLSVSDISRRMEMPKSTTHNLLRTLEAMDFLKQDPADKRYRLGPRLYELGMRFSHNTRLVAATLPHLKRLGAETKETVKLGVLSDNEILVLAAVESPYQLHTRGDEGCRAPLHCTALGKAILATLPAERVRSILQNKGLPRFTPHTIATMQRLEEELARVHEEGYTVDWEENELGVICVAAAISILVDGTAAALSVSAPASRLTRERIREYGERVMETARAVENALGGRRRGFPAAIAPPL
jgi:DNA-binding IclR family transcriptional regulator